MKFKSLNLTLGFALLVVLAGAEAKVKVLHSALFFVSQAATTASATQQQSDVVEEASLSQDPEEREARLAKNMRYNGGRCDITTQDCFFESVYPTGLPLIPLKRSTIAFVGEVSRMQSYLSQDQTHIYTETTVRVEELFKHPENFSLSSGGTLVIDRIGGAIKLRSGKIVRDGTRDGFVGRPQVGMRYVLFAVSIHDGKDFSVMRGYELRDGKVFRLTEDGSPGTVVLSNTRNQPDSLSNEQTFLEAVRKN